MPYMGYWNKLVFDSESYGTRNLPDERPEQEATDLQKLLLYRVRYWNSSPVDECVL